MGAGVQPGEDGPLRAGDEGEDPRAAEALRRGSGRTDQGEGGGDREGGEDVHGRGGQAPGGQGSDGHGREGLWPWAHEVGEGGCRQGGALSRNSAAFLRSSERAFFSRTRRGGHFLQHDSSSFATVISEYRRFSESRVFLAVPGNSTVLLQGTNVADFPKVQCFLRFLSSSNMH